MTLEEALNFWFGRIDFEKKPAQPGDLKLDRMRALLAQLGNPHDRLRIIHVAGTKGKGSTCAMLAAVLRAAGYRVGLFTSPHLSQITERIQVDGVPITPQELTVRMAETAEAVDRMKVGDDPQRRPTFFEIGTALGFLHFDCRRVDVAVVEVGLGGRFDSTNVCNPILSIITSISYDHMAQLGNTLEKIAFEKAGIIKRGRPVVTTAEEPALSIIADVARRRQAALTALDREFSYQYRSMPYPQQAQVQVLSRTAWPQVELGLYGKHQAANAAGVVAAIEELRRSGFVIDDRAIRKGLSEVDWPARLEVVAEHPLTILDCAHNTASATALIDTLAESFPVSGKRHLIFAASVDKQVAEMLQILAPHFESFYFTRFADNPRCAPPETTATRLQVIRPEAAIFVEPSAATALRKVQAAANPEDLIVITGSVFLAGELRTSLQATT